MVFFSTFLISMFITIVLIPPLRRMAIRVHALDMPETRKIHPAPMPKCGGLAMAVGVLVPTLIWAPLDAFTKAFLVGGGIVVLFGLMDDFKSLTYKPKFVGQVAAGLIVILYGGVKIKSFGMLLPYEFVIPDWVAVPWTLVVIVGVTNAINLSDGLDGLAGGICIMSFCCIAYLAYQAGNMVVATLSIAMIGTMIGFLRFNTYPANLFMGDAGSQLLGFSAITLSVYLTQTNAPLSPVLPLVILGFPILDTLTVMSERISKGRSPFKADKNHFHHKLLRLNLFHTEAVVVIYFLQAILVTSAFVLRYHSDWLLLISYVVFSGIVVSAFLVAEKTGWQMGRSFIQETIKDRLRPLKDNRVFVKIFFAGLQWGYPIILLYSVFLPADLPGAFGIVGFVAAGLVLVAGLAKREWLPVVIRIAIFGCVPFLVYYAEVEKIPEINGSLTLAYRAAYGVLALLSILTLKFSTRKSGFRTSPADFLILFIALVVPNLPDAHIQSLHMGLVAAKTIVLLFAGEVIMGEVRGRLNRLAVLIVLVLAIIGTRGIW